MNYFNDNESDLEEEQFNLTVSGPSKAPKKVEKLPWDLDDTKLKNNLLNFNINNDIIAKSSQKEKIEKHKNKPKKYIKQLLEDRLKMYNIAEENARKTGRMKKVRILNRNIQILNALIGHYESGNIIDPDSIPPEIKIGNYVSKSSNPQVGVTFKESAEITVIPRDAESGSSADSEISLEKVLGSLKLRRDQYKISVAESKSAGNVPRTLEHLNIVKMFDSVIRHLERGDKVDLNELPGPPNTPICHINFEEKKRTETKEQIAAENISESSIEEQVISHGLILQSLQQRLKAYEILKMNFRKTNNVVQVKRIDRIVKIYKNAIRLHRARVSIPIESLPSPPGFPPIAHLISSNRPSNI